jgi:UDP-N-acetylglucosamine 2-epimerase (non-hydrolysing)
MKVMCVVGTRPEAVKLAPIIHELRRRSSSEDLQALVCVTAQHRQMLDEVLHLFEIQPDYDLDVMQNNQSLCGVAAAVLARLEPILRAERPDWILVQGDTTTAMIAALAGFYTQVKVGHVEAGLRTYNKQQPYPEEINRRIIDLIADAYFVPTSCAAQHVLREGVPAERVLITGNPVIDALHWAIEQPLPPGLLPPALADLALDAPAADRSPLILVTAHRRENFGAPLERICGALREIAARYPQLRIVYPVHPNPQVQEPVFRLLNAIPNICLTPPLPYLAFVHLLRHAHLVLTDSGGLQEEVPSFGKPVLVLREVTERPEGVDAGIVRLVGSQQATIVQETIRLLEDAAAYAAMCAAVNPYGDGAASQRIVQALLDDAALAGLQVLEPLPESVHDTVPPRAVLQDQQLVVGG